MKLGPVERKIRDAMRGGRAITEREAEAIGPLARVYYRRFLDRGISMRVEIRPGRIGATLREFLADDEAVAAARDERERQRALVKRTAEERQAAEERLEQQAVARAELVKRIAAADPADRPRLIAEQRVLDRAARIPQEAEGDVPVDLFGLDLDTP